MSTAPETELRTAVIAALKVDANVTASAMGAAPRIVNRALSTTALPYIVLDVVNARPWDTTTERGCELDVELRLVGEYEGDKQGEAIFWATQRALRDWAPQALTTHWLVNLVLSFSDVRAEEDGKRYFGLQRWRAVTEEQAGVYVPPTTPPTPSLEVESEERQTRLAAEPISALRVVRRLADGRVSLADQALMDTTATAIGISENAGASGDPINVRTAGVMIDAAWAWTTGAALFLGNSGAITATAPSSGVLLRVGTALSATAILIDLQEPIVLA